MSADDRNTELDILLDAALQNYSRVEPPPGLEQRIQAGLEAAVRRVPHLAWSGWMLPAGAAAVAFAALLFFALRPPAPPAAPPAQVAKTAPAAPAVSAPVAPMAAAPSISRRPRAGEPSAEAATLPRRQRFPAPAPLSEQERLLLLYLQAAPPPAPSSGETPDAFAALTLEPLQFPALRIEKLERNP